MTNRSWAPRLGWMLVVVLFVGFVWGLQRRARLEASGSEVIRMLFVPSVEQGTMVRRADDFARWVREDSGLTLRTEIPTSYAAVIQALGSGQADLAWMPAFAYVIANARYGAEARMQVIRAADLFAIVVTRSGLGEPATLAELADRAVAVPESLDVDLRAAILGVLDDQSPGWRAVSAASDMEAVRLLVEEPFEIAGAVSGWVPSGAYDFVGDGRRELEYERPGTMDQTRVVFRTEEPVPVEVTSYNGCVISRTDSPIRRLEDLNGARFAFSDETSTSGHIFPRMLLDRHGVALGRVYYAGGHPNAVQAVLDGKADGGAIFYSPANATQRREQLLIGDARYLILRRIQEVEERRRLIEQVRVLKLTDPIPNDLCAARRGFPPEIWRRFQESITRFQQTEMGRAVFFDVLSALGAVPTDDSAYEGFRDALRTAGVNAEGLLEAAEERLERRRQEGGS